MPSIIRALLPVLYYYYYCNTKYHHNTMILTLDLNTIPNIRQAYHREVNVAVLLILVVSMDFFVGYSAQQPQSLHVCMGGAGVAAYRVLHTEQLYLHRRV